MLPLLTTVLHSIKTIFTTTSFYKHLKQKMQTKILKRYYSGK